MTRFGSQALEADWIDVHRAAWARKPGVRRVYARWFTALRGACASGPIVEIGCGAGFFKELHPELIATDVTRNAHADVTARAESLPFGTASVGNVVLVDVFHHLPHPAGFLAEAARVLRPGGRIAMIEPWIGLVARFFYRYVHHEDLDLTVDPAAPWPDGSKTPMEGNNALPYLYFKAGGELERSGLPLRVLRREPFAALPWVLSGGFQPLDLLPGRMVGAAERLDRLLSLPGDLTALRSLVVLERVG